MAFSSFDLCLIDPFQLGFPWYIKFWIIFRVIMNHLSAFLMPIPLLIMLLFLLSPFNFGYTTRTDYYRITTCGFCIYPCLLLFWEIAICLIVIFSIAAFWVIYAMVISNLIHLFVARFPCKIPTLPPDASHAFLLFHTDIFSFGISTCSGGYASC